MNISNIFHNFPKTVILFSIVIVFSLIFYLVSIEIGKENIIPDKTKKIVKTISSHLPDSVLESYNTLILNGRRQVQVSKCNNSTKIIYVVDGGSRTDGVRVYFKEDGTLIEKYNRTDALSEYDIKPKINLGEYTCTIIQYRT